MKKNKSINNLFNLVILIILINISFIKNSNAQWIMQQGSGVYDLASIFCVNEKIVYTVGWYGCILKTSDGGLNWIPQISGTTSVLFSVFFFNSDTGFAVGDSGKILSTYNGGVNWNSISNSSNHTYYQIFFSDNNTGWIIGDLHQTNHSVIRKTINGGVNWSIDTIGYSFLRSVFFINNDTGFVAGDDGLMFKTINGGITWNSLNSVTIDNLHCIFFINDSIGFSGSDYDILKTTNGGASWWHIHNAGRPTFSMCFPSIDTGYIVGWDPMQAGGCIMKTTDSGITWNWQKSGKFESIHFVDPNTGYAVTYNGEIYKTTNGGLPVGIKENKYELNENDITIYPNPFYHSFTIDIGSLFNTESKDLQFLFYTESGELIFKKDIKSNTTEVNGYNLHKGMYYYVLKSKNKIISEGKIIKL